MTNRGAQVARLNIVSANGKGAGFGPGAFTFRRVVREAAKVLVTASHTIDSAGLGLYSSKGRTEQLGLVTKMKKTHGMVVSALRARTHFGSLLRQVEEHRGSLVIEKRGTPRAVLVSIRDYVRLAAPEPEILKALGEESRQNRTDTLTSREIDQLIRKTRARKTKR